MVALQSLKGCASKNFWEILIYVIVLGLLKMGPIGCCETFVWCVQSQKSAGLSGQSACQSLKLGYSENMLQINRPFLYLLCKIYDHSYNRK